MTPNGRGCRTPRDVASLVGGAAAADSSP